MFVCFFCGSVSLVLLGCPWFDLDRRPQGGKIIKCKNLWGGKFWYGQQWEVIRQCVIHIDFMYMHRYDWKQLYIVHTLC